MDAGWIDMAMKSPVLDSSLVTGEIGWQPSIGTALRLRSLTQHLALDGVGD